MARQSSKESIEADIHKASAAITNLHVFAAVVGLLESGAVISDETGADKTASKIIALCKKEQNRQLKHMDSAIYRSLKIADVL